MTYALTTVQRVAAEQAREDAPAIARGWAQTPSTRALLGKISMLEDLSDQCAGFTNIVEAIGDELAQLECDLDAAREQAISEALDAYGEDDGGYVEDELREIAPSTGAALAAYRREQREHLTPRTMTDGDKTGLVLVPYVGARL